MFSQIKDTKQIKQDFCSVTWAWVGFGGSGGAQGVNFFFSKHGQVAYPIDGYDE